MSSLCSEARGSRGDAAMFLGDPLREWTAAEQRLQPWIQRVAPGEIVQDALVDAQRRGGEVASPLAARSCGIGAAGRDGVIALPVRVGQKGHGQSER